jgi:uncharacterized protein GlcG (DUF336 family)
MTMRNCGWVLATALVAALQTGAQAQEHVVTYKALSPETALTLAQETLAACRKSGYQVAVAVVDRSGVLQVLLRDRFAGPHTVSTARRKAYTAASFKTGTRDLANFAKPGREQYGVHFVDEALLIGGGLIIEAAGALIGGIGVSGAPGGEADEACAKAGLEKIQDALNF